MRIAILSDIHCNNYALENVLQVIEKENVDKFIFLGDYFGYYPWAFETFNLLMSVKQKSEFIIGNHDKLLIEKTPEFIPEYYHVIEDNKSKLDAKAINWLKELESSKDIFIENIIIKAYHGTPFDFLNGRYYPDNKNEYEWFPEKNEVILLGHTHYPIMKKNSKGGFIVNPGSVGQPRDGILSSSFCIFDTNSMNFDFHRVKFDVEKIINELERIDWYPRAINSLKKKKI